ncbi:MAG: hypothetical protein ACT6RN_22585 [Agrobacterium sp.]|uniref:hypothetical protein n=1 Tax=Agrobacterium sp. TaxID=361 RepID=UPI0040382E11
MSVILTAERQPLNCKAVNKTHRTSLPGVGAASIFVLQICQTAPADFFYELALENIEGPPIYRS